MGPGVPGIGIAGLFYVVVAIVAPIRELYLTTRGRSSRDRWRVVLRQFLLAWTIVAAVVAFYIGLGWLARRGWLGAWGERGVHLFGLANVAVAVVLLAAVLILTALYAVAVRSLSVEDPEVIAFDHRHSIIRGKGDRTLVPVPGPSGSPVIQPPSSPAARPVLARSARVVYSESHGVVVFSAAS
jgi:hypothetical protein